MGRGMEKGKHGLGNTVGGSSSAHDLEWTLLQERSKEARRYRRVEGEGVPQGLRLGLRERACEMLGSAIYCLYTLTVDSRCVIGRVFGNLERFLPCLFCFLVRIARIPSSHVFIVPFQSGFVA